MKMVAETEIEILAENGARLFAAAGPEIEGMRLRVVRDGVSSTVEIDFDETRSLREFLDESVPSGRYRGGTLEFECDGASLAFYPDNMGEPYRSGITVSVRSQPHGSNWAFVENRQAQVLKRFVEQHGPRPAPAPGT
jgi:hypothetical protein